MSDIQIEQEKSQMQIDLELGIAVLLKKKPILDVYFDYYDGNHRLKYNSQKLQDIFKDLHISFTENWCAVVIDSVYQKVELVNMNILTGEQKETSNLIEDVMLRFKRWISGESGPEEKDAVLTRLIEENEILLDSDIVHEVAGIAGESYYMLESGEDGVEGYYNDPRNVHLFYRNDKPRVKRYAIKWWLDEKLRTWVRLYYTDFFWTWRTEDKVEGQFEVNKLVPVDEFGEKVGDGENAIENEIGKLPVFQFRPDRRVIKSDLKNVTQIQDVINKVLADMLVSSEFTALPQRFVISDVDIKGKLKNAPNEIWSLPGGDGASQGTQVGQLQGSQPDSYLKVLDREVGSISAITAVPHHYFFHNNNVPSGEALIALEAPLNSKAGDRVEVFKPIWKDVVACMMEMEGKAVEKQQIEIVFEAPETIQPKTQSEIRQIDVNTGIPLVTVLRREGWSREEIDQMLIDKHEQGVSQNATLAQALVRSQRDFSAGDDIDPGGEVIPTDPESEEPTE